MSAVLGGIRWVFVDEYDMPRLGWMMAGMVVCFFLLIALTIVGVQKASYPGERAGYEQLRLEVQRVNGNSAEGIYRVAAEQNMELVSRQECNRHWYCGWSEDDRWNAVQPIVIPEQ